MTDIHGTHSNVNLEKVELERVYFSCSVIVPTVKSFHSSSITVLLLKKLASQFYVNHQNRCNKHPCWLN